MAINKLAFAGILLAIFVNRNRMLFGISTGSLPKEYEALVQPKDDVLQYYLEKHHKQIGSDFVPYKNHCLRVLAFTKYFLARDGIQLKKETMHVISMALAYHDIALWTDRELNYLEPSVGQLEKRVTEEMQQTKKQGEGDEASMYVPKILDWSNFMEEEQILAKEIILQHHKITHYRHDNNDNDGNDPDAADKNDSNSGSDATTTTTNNYKKINKKNYSEKDGRVEYMNEIVNAVRKADWADATMGIVRFGLPQSVLAAAYDVIPEAGFHKILLGMGARLSPNNLMKRMDVLRILKF